MVDNEKGFRRKSVRDHSLPPPRSTDNLAHPENTDHSVLTVMSTTELEDDDDANCNSDLGNISSMVVEESKVHTLSSFPTPDELTNLLTRILELIKNKDITTLRETFEANFYKVEVIPRRGCNDTHYSKLNIVNMVDKLGNSPLIEACKVSTEIANLLLEYGADPNHRTLNLMECSLSIAALRGDTELVKTLVWYGANVAAAVIILTEGLGRGGKIQNDKFFSIRSLGVLVNGDILARCADPIDTAFSISKHIKNISSFREEYKIDLREIQEDADNFAVDFLDKCEKMWEARHILSYRSGTVRKALTTQKMKFIAHPFAQQILLEEWYGPLIYRSNAGWAKLYLTKFISPLVVPVYLFISLLKPPNSNAPIFFMYQKHMDLLFTPFVCFVTDTVNYLMLLGLLIWVCLVGPHLYPQGLDIVLWFCVLSRIVIEVEQLVTQGRRHYFSSFWNWLDCTVCATLTITAIYHLAIFGIVITSENEIENDGVVLTVGSVSVGAHLIFIMDIYAVTEMLLFLRWINVLDVTQSLGPLQLAVKRMLKDVAQVIIFLATCLIGFAIAIHAITNSVLEVQELKSRGKNQKGDISVPDAISGLENTTLSLFWSVFGLIEIPELKFEHAAGGHNTKLTNGDHHQEFWVTEHIVVMLFAIYVILAVVVMLNMLIAMMNNTYQAIQDNCDTEWKFARAKLIQEYKNGQPFMFPFLLIAYPLVVMHRSQAKKKKLEIAKGKNALMVALEETQQRDKLILKLSDRYLNICT